MTREYTGRRGLLALAASMALCSDLAYAAAPETRRAADWTLEERLEMRFNEESMRARRHEAAKEAGPEWAPDDEGLNIISGTRNPELFAPHELFQSLLHNAYGPIQESGALYRDKLTPLCRALGFEETFWGDLEIMARDLLDVDRERRRLNKGFATMSAAERTELSEKVNALQAWYCRDRARILEEAMVTFGREKFHVLLYHGVAPSVAITSEATAEQVRFIAGGCQ
ncbi:MAG TPA: hypothetical protein DD490_30160 [Acidobacteria bacterium]|nr:hypothetical protein [Acidobacteriota bacterium]